MQKMNIARGFQVALILIVLTLIAFEPIRHNGFVDYDDYDYITKNHHLQSGITPRAVIWVFTSGYAVNWHPLTWLSHMLDVELFGMNPFGHHLHNVILHIISTLLLFLILHAMFRAIWFSAFIAVVFGLHPLRVESVAWASERKDVLSVLYFMLTLAAYLYYTRHRGGMRYLLVILCFGLGLMAKPMLVTLPLILLLLDYWPLKRWRKSHLLNDAPFQTGCSPDNRSNSISLIPLCMEKIPLFLLSLASCIVTFMVQHSAGSVMRVSFHIRLLNALTSYTAYLTKILCPIDLAAIYPYPTGSIPLAPPIISLLILVFWSVFAVYNWRKRPYFLVGWLWYIIMLLPVIGLVQVGSQAMADRYTYLPSIGIVLIIACAVSELTAAWRYRRHLLTFVSVLVTAAMILLTRNQVTYWKNSLVLYEHAAAVTPNNYIAENGVGQTLLENNRLSGAADHLLSSLKIQPDYPCANANMALLCMLQNKPDAALTYVHNALGVKHQYSKVYYNCGLILDQLNHISEAKTAYEQAVKFNPDSYMAQNRLDILKEKQDLPGK